MHLAAETHVDRSIDSPLDFIETNINGTLNMLEASRSYWQDKGQPAIFRFHHISTDEVFGSLSSDPDVLFTEDTPYDPRSPYSASKASSDHFKIVISWNELPKYAAYPIRDIIKKNSNLHIFSIRSTNIQYFLSPDHSN